MNHHDKMVTYRRADGELVAGLHGWVTDLDYFDDADEPVKLIAESWERYAVETIMHHPHPCFCSECVRSDVRRGAG